MDLYKAKQAYESDPVFHQLVTTLKAYMYKMDYTPGELRAAAMLAAVQFECEQIRTTILPPENSGIDYAVLRHQNATPPAGGDNE